MDFGRIFIPGESEAVAYDRTSIIAERSLSKKEGHLRMSTRNEHKVLLEGVLEMVYSYHKGRRTQK